MSLVVNHNLMAMNAARNLGTIFSKLAVSTQRLSSGLRVNSAADDAAGLAVREMMRADIAAINQGVRNAGDAISLIQTAEGALSVIDEKLTRMKELAQQAATGTYTTLQRAIMDSEYQAMAAEIDRIANATDFNGVKLLDGSLTQLHGGNGMKIHFGGGNSSAEDYYYISIADMRATEATGIRVGNGGTAALLQANTFFASAGVIAASDQYFAYSYDANGDGSTTLSDFAGFYRLASGTTLLGMVDLLNQGTAARTFLTVEAAADADSSGEYIQLGNLRVFIAAASNLSAGGVYTGTNPIGVTITAANSPTNFALALVSAINALSGAEIGNVWARASDNVVMILSRTPGAVGNGIVAASGTTSDGLVTFSGTTLTGGGATWAVAEMRARESDNYRYLALKGYDRGENYTITVQNADTLGFLTALVWADANDDFTVTAPTGNANWDGANILTQSAAQLALAQIDAAIILKEKTRAGLGSLQNRLENTITNLQIQGENLQAAESRISDVDVATEMTEFTKNNILAQAATAMLAQANALPQLALQLLGGV